MSFGSLAWAIFAAALSEASVAQPLETKRTATPTLQGQHESIMITGHRARREEIRDLARAVTPKTLVDEPFTRLNGPACVKVAGISEVLTSAIAARMTAKAREAGIVVPRSACHPNIYILFTESPEADIATLSKRRPEVFGELSPGAIKKSAQNGGPVYSWNAVEDRSRGGDSTYIDPVTKRRSLKQPQSSHLTLQLRRDLSGAVLLVDTKAAVGKTTVQLADYAFMRTLANATDNVRQSDPTILALFKGSTNPPSEMTYFDDAYFKELYRGPGSVRSFQKVSDIVARVIESADDAR